MYLLCIRHCSQCLEHISEFNWPQCPSAGYSFHPLFLYRHCTCTSRTPMWSSSSHVIQGKRELWTAMHIFLLTMAFPRSPCISSNGAQFLHQCNVIIRQKVENRACLAFSHLGVDSGIGLKREKVLSHMTSLPSLHPVLWAKTRAVLLPRKAQEPSWSIFLILTL
jgi:hypothetical protein